MRQVLCVWFPNWPMQRITVEQPELRGKAVVLHSPREDRLPSVTACSSRAARGGVQVGMPLAEAQTLVPFGRFFTEDPAEDQNQLRRLAWQCQRFTPQAGLEEADRPECLFLDVTGCVPHFGDIHQLCEQVRKSFRDQGYLPRIAVAPTFGAAWAVVHGRDQGSGFRDQREKVPVTVVAAGELERTLSSLPLWGLRLPEATLLLLEECGLQTIGQLQNLPRSSLPARFGPELLLRLDQACGNVDELLLPDLPPRPIQVKFQFEFPLLEQAALEHVLRRLLEDVIVLLKQHQRETQQVLVIWKTEVVETGEFHIRLLRPTASPDKLWELLPLHLERLRIAGGIVAVQAEAIPCPRDVAQQKRLFDRDDPREPEFLSLIERLSSRLGEQAVIRYRLLPEAQPEWAAVAEPWLGRRWDEGEEKPEAERNHSRPLQLLAAPIPVSVTPDEITGFPQRFTWKHREHDVSLCEGPERIETGWWRAMTARRDYYRVETKAGARFWLFQDRVRGKWFLQGMFE